LALPNGHSPPTAFPEHTPQEDQQPGYYWGVNDDFDEGKSTEDREDPSPASLPPPVLMTDDMVRLYLELMGYCGVNCGDDRVKVYLWSSATEGDDREEMEEGEEAKARLFAVNPSCLAGYVACDGSECANCYDEITPNQDIAPDYLLSTGSKHDWQFYLEGTSPDALYVKTIGIIDGTRKRLDGILVKIVQIDVDVDSDNTKTEAPFGPDGSIEEDRIEDRDDLPGRIVLVNDDDDDNDGVVDYGDGYNLMSEDEAFQDDIAHGENDFIEMKLRVPAPVDLAVARIRVTYQASDPSLATYEYSPGPPYSITPAPGLLRIWTTTGSECRFRWSPPGGDYFAPDTYPASALGLSNGTREVSLWLEGISPGQTRVLFELDPDGDGPADFVHSDAFRVTVLKVAIVNPTAPTWVYSFDMGQKTPRIMTPANAPLFSGNEFTYSDAYPDGVLTVPVFIQIEPDTAQIRALFEDKIRTRVSAVDDSHLAGTNVQLTWDHPFPGEPTAGKAMYGDPLPMPLWQAKATFIKLPPDNDDFGRKTLTVDFLGTAGKIVCSPRIREYEIFFARDATNHPDLPGKLDLEYFSATDVDNAGRGNSTRSQNWFFYWNRTSAGDPEARFDSNLQATGATGATPAVAYWEGYAGPRARILVHFENDSDLRDTINSTGTPKTGIDRFADTILHEARHVKQVIEHNGLNPHNVATASGAKIGWSWCTIHAVVIARNRANIQAARYNHFQTGPDGKPGKAGFDDDSDGPIDEFDLDEFIAGPDDTVTEDDIDLDPDGDNWGTVPTEPDPNQNADGDGVTPEWDNPGWQDNRFSGDKGSQSNRAETTLQGHFAQYDWARPGKQHGPDLATENADGEYNRYDD
jgi:hypothetical protein